MRTKVVRMNTKELKRRIDKPKYYRSELGDSFKVNANNTVTAGCVFPGCENGSLTVSLDTGDWTCSVCGKDDVLGFYMKRHTVPFSMARDYFIGLCEDTAKQVKPVASTVPEMPTEKEVFGGLGEEILKDNNAVIALERFAAADAPVTAIPETITDVWPDPIPLNRYSDLPVFPIDSLPEFGRKLVKTVSAVCQVDPGMPGSQYLAVLSTCLGGKYKVNLKTHTEPCNLYFAQMLDSGERKSKTTSIMTDPVYECENAKAEEMAREIREAINQHRIREARLAKLQKKAADADDAITRGELAKEASSVAEEIARNPVPKAPVYIFDDITPEKVGEMMAGHNERGSIITPEGGIFDIMAGRYSEGRPNLDIWLKAHAGDPWTCHRIGRDSVSMMSPALTLSLAIQSSVIREIGHDNRFRGRGLLARFLYSMCQSKAGHRARQTDEIPDSLQREYKIHVEKLMDLPKSDRLLALSQEGQALWDEFYNDVEGELRPGGSLEFLKDWGSKLPGAVARITGLLHVAEHGGQAIDQPASVDTVQAASVIGGYFKEHAIAVFDYMGEDPKIEAAKLILEYIGQHRPKTFKGRDVMQNKSALKSMDDVLPGLKILIERGYIREGSRRRPGEKGGRPGAPEYEVNPKFNFYG